MKRVHLRLSSSHSWLPLALAMFVLPPAGAEKSAPLSPLDQFIQDALNRPAAKSDDHRGSNRTPASHLADAARDLRASQVDDVLTILVVERASAVSRGSVQSSRQANANAGVGALGGITRATGPLANLANLSSETDLQGQGATTRETVLNTSLAARVAHVLHNGYLVIEAAKEVQVNSERQLVTVRGVVRPEDISSGNVIRSDRITQMELRINGKGVVGDAVRRPNFLYRILLGILPF